MVSQGAQQLAEHIRKSGKTLEQVARFCGVDAGQICRWRSGERKPDITNRKVMQIKLQIPFDSWDEAVVKAKKQAA